MKLKHMWKHPKVLFENICLFCIVIVFFIYDYIIRKIHPDWKDPREDN